MTARMNFCIVVAQERDHYSQFVSEAFDSYVDRKEKDGVHGNNPEMQAASELFNRPIEVYVPEKGSEFQANGCWFYTLERIRRNSYRSMP